MSRKVVDIKATGERIKELMDKARIDLPEMAKLTGITRQSLYNAINGENLLNLENFCKIKIVLGCKLDDMLVPDEEALKELREKSRELRR